MFFKLDDSELISSLRQWTENTDRVLSDLAKAFLYRRLPAIELSDKPFPESGMNRIIDILNGMNDFRSQDIGSYVYTGSISNITYAPSAPSVKIMKKDGSLKEVTEVSSILRHETLSKSTNRHYLCYPKDIRSIINK